MVHGSADDNAEPRQGSLRDPQNPDSDLDDDASPGLGGPAAAPAPAAGPGSKPPPHDTGDDDSSPSSSPYRFSGSRDNRNGREESDEDAFQDGASDEEIAVTNKKSARGACGAGAVAPMAPTGPPARAAAAAAPTAPMITAEVRGRGRGQPCKMNFILQLLGPQLDPYSSKAPGFNP
jgi:hypothetical protein